MDIFEVAKDVLGLSLTILVYEMIKHALMKRWA